MSKSADYDIQKVEIEECTITGVRIDRVHGQDYRVKPRLYLVRDGNLRTRGQWTVQLHPKWIAEKNGGSHEATVVSIFLAPLSPALCSRPSSSP